MKRECDGNERITIKFELEFFKEFNLRMIN